MSYTWSDVGLAVDYITIKRSPKTGVRAYARTPVFGESFNFREIPVIGHNEGTDHGADQRISTEEIASAYRR